MAAAEGDALLSVVFLSFPMGEAVPNHELLPIAPAFDDGSVVAVVVMLLEKVLVDLPAREEVCLSLSESTRGSALLARSEAWGPEVVLLDVGSTAGPRNVRRWTGGSIV
jgi:hypothetical protein